MSEPLSLPETPPLRPHARVHVALSGGLDSMVLLHRLQRSPLRPRLRVLHVHHGLQAVADEWAGFCEAQATARALPFTLLRVQVVADGTGPEAAAREARYAALAAQMRPGDVLVTAHHQQDQAETLLLNLLRGAGVEGLAGMRPLEPFAAGWHWRPLLDEARDTLRQEALAQGLPWVEDPHNADGRYARSWLRTEILPRLQSRWPQAPAALARAAAHCREAAEVVEQCAAADLAQGCDATGLRISALRELQTPRRAAMLRYWLRAALGQSPTQEALRRVQSELIEARADATPVLRIGAGELRRYRDHLICFRTPLPAVSVAPPLRWDGRGRLPLPHGAGELRAPARGRRQDWSVRCPAGGERLRVSVRQSTRTLKNLCQEAGVPPWIRERMPLIYRDDELICVGGRWWAACIPLSQRQLVWHHDLPGWNPMNEEHTQ